MRVRSIPALIAVAVISTVIFTLSVRDCLRESTSEKAVASVTLPYTPDTPNTSSEAEVDGCWNTPDN